MSMIGNLARIPEEVRQALHQSPDKILDFLYPEAAEQEPKKPGFLSRLFGRQSQTALGKSSMEPFAPLSEEDSTDIDKTWHALHFLFTGSAWGEGFPQGFLATAGKPIGDVDVGYGPARSFSPSEVSQIHDFLQSLVRDDLRGRLIPGQMEKEEIYPSYGTGDALSDEDWNYIAGGLDEVRTFVAETVRQNKALLVYIN